MSSRFIAPAADAYDTMMGRWSRRLAPLLLDFAGLEGGERIADIGCGTGSLTLTALDRADVAAIEAIDYNPAFVEALRGSNSDRRVSTMQGDATSLQFPDSVFDRVFSLLVLHFVSDAQRAVDEMQRVLKPGGTAAAAVWDTYGGMPNQRLFWDTVAAIEPSAVDRRATTHGKPMTSQGEIADCFIRTGLEAVEETMLTVRMDCESFESYWCLQTTGQGDTAKWLDRLPQEQQARIRAAVRSAYLCNRPDGPRSFALVAWAAKGRRPA